jgi:hypothetical protein
MFCAVREVFSKTHLVLRENASASCCTTHTHGLLLGGAPILKDNYGIDSWNVDTCLYAHTRPILGRFLAWGIAKNTTTIMEIILKLSAQRAADRHYT